MLDNKNINDNNDFFRIFWSFVKNIDMDLLFNFVIDQIPMTAGAN